MPVKSLNSSVLKWPDAQTVDRELRKWAEKAAQSKPGVLAIAYIGSYARGDWGPGSDLDVLIVVEDSSLPFERRSAEWDLTDLSAPVDVLVYTRKEWESLPSDARFLCAVRDEARWIFTAPSATHLIG